MNKDKKTLFTLLMFVVVAAAMIVIGICACNVPVVPMCVLVILEVGIAVMLHHVELWIHGVLLLAELLVGVLAGKVVLVILCVLVYAAATIVLQMLDRGEQQNG
ncbi:MAG: hypothetical protein PUA77_10105 [Lachnospiraceae bacterium]|nr:hypothetical protein [Agathobacter sp.]MDD6292117.1 hypothetical protein [Lachnospiraceae bacterium]